jgi:LmbE family N-acetylglucosaminyl deacetylase
MPPVLRTPPEPLLVIAPHADDEAIGCGGTLALARQATVVLLTGDDARRAEARTAAALLGVQLEHLYLVDGAIPDRGAVEEQQLRDVLQRLRPRCILVPYPLDRHPDHARTARLVARVVDDAAEIWCYEVWSPLDPNRLVDVTSVVDVKRRAIEAHASQTRDLDYVDAALGLNRYRALLASGADYAEGFFACSVDELRALSEPR